MGRNGSAQFHPIDSTPHQMFLWLFSPIFINQSILIRQPHVLWPICVVFTHLRDVLDAVDGDHHRVLEGSQEPVAPVASRRWCAREEGGSASERQPCCRWCAW